MYLIFIIFLVHTSASFFVILETAVRTEGGDYICREPWHLKKSANYWKGELMVLVNSRIQGMEPNIDIWDKKSTFQSPQSVGEYQSWYSPTLNVGLKRKFFNPNIDFLLHETQTAIHHRVQTSASAKHRFWKMSGLWKFKSNHLFS